MNTVELVLLRKSQKIRFFKHAFIIASEFILILDFVAYFS